MTSIRHDRKGNIVKLNEAMYKREFRLFDLPELYAEADHIRNIARDRGQWHAREALARILDVIAEKEAAVTLRQLEEDEKLEDDEKD